MTANYDIGYAKPPKNTQFKKGKSGNPGGRPKGAKNLYKSLVEALATPVKVQMNGKQCKKPLLVATAIALSLKAMQGNVQAFNSLFDKFQKCVEKMPSGSLVESVESHFEWTEEDEKLEKYLADIVLERPGSPKASAPDNEQPY